MGNHQAGHRSTERTEDTMGQRFVQENVVGSGPQDAKVTFDPDSTTSVPYNTSSGAQQHDLDPATSAFSDSCIICFRENIAGIKMPCCGKDSSDIRYCQDCLIVLAEHLGPSTSTGTGTTMSQQASTTGRCPTCKKYYRWRKRQKDVEGGKNEQIFEVCTFDFEHRGRCRMCCQQPRTLVDNRKQLCEPCLMGQQYTFRYECDRCHRMQRIPHPMWKYQPSPLEFSSVTWACHQSCDDYTHWKIERSCLSDIPEALMPAQWLVAQQGNMTLDEDVRALVRARSLARNLSSE